MTAFLIGLDLAQASDYTAISILERTGPQRLDVRYLERVQDRSYVAVAADVRDLVARLCEEHAGAEVTLVYDRTGVGAAVGDVMAAAGIAALLVPVLIHGGDRVTAEGGIWRVPKRDLVSALVVAFQNGTLRIAPALRLAPVLVEELGAFRLRFNPQTAHDSYSAWREGQHDDLVLSVALAVWWASRSAAGPAFTWLDPDDW